MSTSCRVVCPTCRGAGERCAACDDRGHLDAGDRGYAEAVATWAERGVDPPPEA